MPLSLSLSPLLCKVPFYGAPEEWLFEGAQPGAPPQISLHPRLSWMKATIPWRNSGKCKQCWWSMPRECDIPLPTIQTISASHQDCTRTWTYWNDMASISSIKKMLCISFHCSLPFRPCHRRDKNQTKEQLQTITGINSGRDTYDRASDLCSMQFSAYSRVWNLGPEAFRTGENRKNESEVETLFSFVPAHDFKTTLNSCNFRQLAWSGTFHAISWLQVRISEPQNKKMSSRFCQLLGFHAFR